MEVYLYHLNKRINSTIVPSRADGTMVEGAFHFGTSVRNPILDFDQPYITMCYVEIPSLARYYYVDDWTYNDGFWSAHLSVDVLGSLRGAIRSSMQYVTRSTNGSDVCVIDSAYPLKSNPLHTVSKPTSQTFAYTFNSGMYVLGVLGGSGGAVSYYAMGQTFFHSLCEEIFDTTKYYTGISAEEISEELFRSIVNPAQYIESVRWYPFQQFPADAATPTTFTIGQYSWGITSGATFDTAIRQISTPYVQHIDTITLAANHPQKTRIGSASNLAPFTVRKLYYPPFGDFVLDSPSFVLPGVLSLVTDTDLTTGLARLTIRHTDGLQTETIITERQTMFAVSIPVKSSTYDLSSKGFEYGAYAVAADKAFDAIGRYANRNATEIDGLQITTEQGILTGIASAILSTSISGEIVGQVGSILQFRQEIRLDTWYYSMVDENTVNAGRPYCGMAQLGGFDGQFVTCDRPSLVASAAITSDEVEKAKAYLSSGVWIE